MTVRCVFNFGYRGAGIPAGFSEVHWRINDSDVSQSRQPCIDYVKKRIKLFGPNIDVYSVRLSREEAPRQKDRIISAILGQQGNASNLPTEADPVNASLKAGQPNKAVIMLGKHQDFRTRTFYLAGMPDDISRTDPPGPAINAIPGFNAVMTQWRDFLLGGEWGFKARVLAPTVKVITGLSNEVGGEGRIRVRLPLADAIGAPGVIIQIRGAKPENSALGKLNGQWVIDERTQEGEGAEAVVHLTLRKSGLIPAGNFNPMGTIELVTYTYLPYTKVEILGQGTRKRGVGSVRRRGRSKRPARRL